MSFSRVQNLVGDSESFLSNAALDIMNISRYISQLLLLFAFWSQLKEILSRKCNCKQSRTITSNGLSKLIFLLFHSHSINT